MHILKRSLLFVICANSLAFGSIVQINGKWCDDKFAPIYSIPEHYDLGYRHFQAKEWEEALHNFLVIAIHYPASPYYADALYYSGICYYSLGDFDLANKQFSKYLELGTNLQHFEKVFEYKYYIANEFANGGRKHLFGVSQLPRVFSGKDDAVAIYDEVIASLPSRDIGAQALFGKAELLRTQRKYREAIETFMILARRFPKHRLAPECYLTISEVYLEQSQLESQDPNLISLAKLNLERFQKAFPGETRLATADHHLLVMKENFGSNLYEVGRFYEKKKKHAAASLYYNEVVKKYPETQAASKSQGRLNRLVAKKLA